MPRGCWWWATRCDKGPVQCQLSAANGHGGAPRGHPGVDGGAMGVSQHLAVPSRRRACKVPLMPSFVGRTHMQKTKKNTPFPIINQHPRRSRHSDSFFFSFFLRACVRLCVGGVLFFIKYYLLIIARKTMGKFSGRTSDENATIWTSLAGGKAMIYFQQPLKSPMKRRLLP